MELAQIAGEGGFIAGTALTMVALTMVVRAAAEPPRMPAAGEINAHRACAAAVQGLALGFVLLRVESLVEEGKL
jgi:hypothetical protein